MKNLSTTWKLALVSLAFALPALGAATAANWTKHPAIKKAYDNLGAARLIFEGGKPNPNPAFADEAAFGGHRKKAYELLKQSMAELETAVETADAPKK